MSDVISDSPLLSDGINSGNLCLRIAGSAEEVKAAQTLRYRVFYEEMGGIPSPAMQMRKRDFDEFDHYCDHLVVLDYESSQTGQVVGTYRLLRRSQVENTAGFYSETEFDISAIKGEKGEILELGRSCVHPAYRDRAVIQLLLRGIASYITLYDIKYMFGCASFFGNDVNRYSLPLSYLYHYHTAPREICPVAIPEKYLEMNLMNKESIDIKEAFSALPALIKGYLRMNCYTGCGAVFDPHFNTIDVGIVVKTDLISNKYTQRYTAHPVAEK